MSFHRLQPYNDLPALSGLGVNFEITEVLRSLNRASRSLADLKGFCEGIRDMAFYSETLFLADAKDNVEIALDQHLGPDLYEAIATGDTEREPIRSIFACKKALHLGTTRLRERKNHILFPDLEDLAALICSNEVRRSSDTAFSFRNQLNGEVVYTPPNGDNVLMQKLNALEHFVNDPWASSSDPLIKMALIHYQFEAIRPFEQGNGRSGRILNALYMVQQDLLALPVLTLSGYFRRNQEQYFALIQRVTHERRWIHWVLFVLEGVYEVSRHTLDTLRRMQKLKTQMELSSKNALGFHYKEDMLPFLWKHPYFTLEQLTTSSGISEKAASLLIQRLIAVELVSAHAIGDRLYFANHRLLAILEEK